MTHFPRNFRKLAALGTVLASLNCIAYATDDDRMPCPGRRALTPRSSSPISHSSLNADMQLPCLGGIEEDTVATSTNTPLPITIVLDAELVRIMESCHSPDDFRVVGQRSPSLAGKLCEALYDDFTNNPAKYDQTQKNEQSH